MYIAAHDGDMAALEHELQTNPADIDAKVWAEALPMMCSRRAHLTDTKPPALSSCTPYLPCAAQAFAYTSLAAVVCRAWLVASPISQDKDRWTPLFGAVGQNRLAAAARLLEAGAEADALDKDGSTPLMLAARKGHLALVRLLLDAGADCTRKHRVRCRPWHTTHNEASLSMRWVGDEVACRTAEEVGMR